MQPTLFGFDSYAVCLVGASICGTVGLVVGGRAEGLAPGRILVFAVALGFAGFLGGKVYFQVEQGFGGFGGAVWWGGYRQAGGLAGIGAVCIPAALLLFGRRGFFALDALVPGIAAGVAVVRIGCLLRGCCFGPLYSGVLGVRFAPGTPAWLFQEKHGLVAGYELATRPMLALQVPFGCWAVVSAIAVWRIVRRRRLFPGQILVTYVAVSETGKFLLEFLRADPPNAAVTIQDGSLMVALVAGFVALSGWAIARSLGPTASVDAARV